jgi:phosphodiesterase/alkaline phosphatase D-like protein
VALIPALVFSIPAICFLIAWKRTRSMLSLLILGAAIVVVLGAGGAVAYSTYQHGYGPSHPQSALPPLPETPVVWMWSGGVTDSAAVVTARIDGDDAELELATEAGGAGTYTGTQTDGVWRFSLSDLTPITTYRYRFVVDGVLEPLRVGQFRTFSTDPMSFTIALGSCARLGSAGKVFETILAMDPDLFISTGDFFYADYITTASQFAAAYDDTLTSPPQAALYAAVPIAYTWDDHDYGGNDSDSTAPGRDQALSAYENLVPHYPLTDTGAINQAFSIGRVRIILLDGRSAREPDTLPDGPNKTMLGTAQLDWFENELRTSSQNHALVIVTTSVPWISAPIDGGDDWGGFTTERRTIANFLADNDIDNVMMIAGDAHMLAIDDGTNTDYSDRGGHGFPLFHAAALDRPGSFKGGPYSEGAFPGGGQFGVITVTDDGGPILHVTLAGYNWTGARLIDYSFEVASP